MENLEREIREWREMPQLTTPLSTLRLAPGLQPRDPRLTLCRTLAREEAASVAQVERLTALLRMDSQADLDPLLVAMVEGKQFVVDGHHRLKAYRLAGRMMVPVCARGMTLAHASLLSKIVNLDAVKLPMDSGQLREAAWQFLAHVTDRGAIELSALGLSTRSVAAKFGGMSHQTVATMVSRFPTVREALRADAFHPNWCDAISGWPRWKDARGRSAVSFGDVSAEVRERRQLEKCAAAIAKLQEQFGPDIYERALALLVQEDAEPCD